MKNCFLLLIFAVLQLSLNLRYGRANDCGELVCKISKSDSTDDELCISGNSPPRNVTVGEEEELISSCTWNMDPGMKKYRFNLKAPEGWVFLLQVNCTRIFVEARDIEPPGNQGSISSSLIYNTTENYHILVPDHYLSTTNRIWIRLSYPEYRQMYNDTSFRVSVRTVQEIEIWTVKQSQCTIYRENAWGIDGYDGNDASNGSLNIMCNNTRPVHQVLITFHYNITKIGISQVPFHGFIQIIYTNVNPRFLIKNKLKMTCDFSNQDSFWIRFDATGSMKLKIYDGVVHSFIYDRDDDGETATSITEIVSPPSSSSLNSTSVSLPSTQSSTTALTANSTSILTGQAAASTSSFLIPTVSVVAIFVLVSLAILFIFFRKRCHTNQSRGRESAPLNDPASFNNEQHEYCEVRPSVKSPPDKTASCVTDQSVGHKNYAFVVTGPAMVMADEETAHSDDKTAKVKTPTANNKVLSNGPVYTLVDMEKKVLDREEKADNARNRGNEYVCNVDRAYATVELDDAFGDKDGQTEGKEPNSSSRNPAPRSSSIKNDNSGAPMNQYEQMQLSDKGITDIHKTPECHTNHDEPELLGTSPTEPYDALQLRFKSSVSSDFSKGDIQTKGQSSDDLEHAYQMVSGPSSSGVSSRPDSFPLSDYETVTVAPPLSTEASASLRPDSYPLSDYETVSPPMSHATIDSEQERPYDTLQRGPDIRKQTATSPTASTVDKKAKEEADHEDAFNVYNEIATPDVTLKESEEGSEAYQHLQRPLSKRPKAGAPLPEIPDEGYGRLNLEGSGASNQTDSQGPKTTQVDPMYAILEKPSEANVPDDDDPEYDLLDAFV